MKINPLKRCGNSSQQETNNKKPYTPSEVRELFSAIDRDDMETLSHILSHNVSLLHATDTSGLMAIHRAALEKRIDALLLLLEFGADVEALYAHPISGMPAQTALHCAAASGDTEIIRLLLLHDANDRAVDGHSKTAYQIAQFYEHWECVRTLGSRSVGHIKRQSAIQPKHVKKNLPCLENFTPEVMDYMH